MELVVSFLSLSLLEIILGIDNIVLLAILVGKLKSPSKQRIAKFVGLSLALVLRIAMLLSLFWLTKLTTPLFYVGTHPVSTKNIVMLIGGIVLLYRGLKEVKNLFNEAEENHHFKMSSTKKDNLFGTICEIAFFDFVFALDSILVAVAIANHVNIMIAANVFAIIIMLALINIISQFLNANPRFKLLGLAFVCLIGASLLAEGIGFSIPKEYIYFAILFSFVIEVLNAIYNKKVGQKK